MLEKGRRLDISSTYPCKTRKNYLPGIPEETRPQTHQNFVPAVHVQVQKRMRKILPALCVPKKRNSKFKLLATLPNNAEAGKIINVTDSSPRIRPDLLRSECCNTKNAYWQTVYIYARSIRYAVDFSISGRRKEPRKFRRANHIFLTTRFRLWQTLGYSCGRAFRGNTTIPSSNTRHE